MVKRLWMFAAVVWIVTGWLLPRALFADFYVSPSGSDCSPPACGTLAAPFRTIDWARQAVAGVNGGMTSDITIYIRGGTYPLSNTLSFGASDSGLNGHNVIYSGYPGDPTPVLSGGVEINGWSAATVNGKAVWKANAGSMRFRQLYVNDNRAIRARSPNSGSYYFLQSWDLTNQRIAVNSGEVASWGNLNSVEIVINQEWYQDNMRIASIADQGNGTTYVYGMSPDAAVIFSRASWMASCCTAGTINGEGYYFENALELLDSPGEWYEDPANGDVYYMPLSGETMSTAVVIAPALERLVGIQGSAGAPVHNLQFQGLAFEYSTWLAPSSYGFNTEQADVLDTGGTSDNKIPGAVYVQYANNLLFKRDIFRYLGASGADLVTGVQDTTLIGNVFEDIAASAIDVYSVINQQSNPTSAGDVCARVTIQDNYINRVAKEYKSSVGIFALFPASLSIVHNEITDSSYSGISVGWGWTDSLTSLANNMIAYNSIHNVVNQMADGGGIYVMSNQPGTTITENYIYNIALGPGAGFNGVNGIYMDEASDNMTVTNNVINNISGTNSNILFEHMIGANDLINNNGGTDPAAIVPAPGIEPAYADIIAGGPAPPPPSPQPAAPRGLQVL